MSNYKSHPRIHRLTDRILSFILKDPKLGGLMLKIMINKVEGDYSYGSDKIISGLESLYKSGEAEIANEIAIHLVEQSNFYPIEVYNKYNDTIVK